MAKRRLFGEPPPDRPFGQVWPRDRDPNSPKKTSKVSLTVPRLSRATRVRRFAWRRVVRPFLLWSKDLIKRACDELLVFSLKALALVMIIAFLSGSVVALRNYSLRHIVDTVVVTLSKQHGIETGSIGIERTKPTTPNPEELPQVTPPAPQKDGLPDGIETGSIGIERTKPTSPSAEKLPQVTPPASQKHGPPLAMTKRRPMATREKTFFDRLIDRIDEALGWKKK